MSYIYAFDLSMSCVGLTIFSNDAKPVLVTSIDTKSEKEHRMKLKLIADRLMELKNKYKPERIVLEGGFSRFNASTQAIFKCHGVVNYLFYDVEQIYYQPLTVKKIVGGKGNMDKKALMQVIHDNYYNGDFKNNDESDAFAVGLCHFIKNGIIGNMKMENN